MSAINLKDIAALVGVSTTAVSNVLNDMPIRISEKKRRLIIKTARKLHYRPNLIARSLKRRKADAIGVVVPDMSTLFYPDLIRSLETELFQQGYQTLICNSDDSAVCEKEHLETLRSRFIDGLIIAPVVETVNAPLLRRICDGGVPVICVDRYLPKEKFFYVTTDGRSAARQGTVWLKKADVQRIFYLGECQRHSAIDDRLAGVKDIVKLCPDDVILCAPERKTIYKRSIDRLRSLPVGSGFFFESYRFLPGFLEAAHECGLTIPHDAHVVGFDPPVFVINSGKDFKAWQALTAEIPALIQNEAAMAHEVVRRMKAKLKNPSAEFQPVRFPAEFCFNGLKTDKARR